MASKGLLLRRKQPGRLAGELPPLPAGPKAKRRLLRGGLLVAVGYILSPASWWNDAVVNLPLAYGFAFLFGLLSRHLFTPALILSYWLTNVAGLLMMHYGIVGTLRQEEKKYGWREVGKDLLISVCYTLVIAALAWKGWIRFPAGHLPRPG